MKSKHMLLILQIYFINIKHMQIIGDKKLLKIGIICFIQYKNLEFYNVIR